MRCIFENYAHWCQATMCIIIGNQVWKGKGDLVNIIMIGLAKEISPKEELIIMEC